MLRSANNPLGKSLANVVKIEVDELLQTTTQFHRNWKIVGKGLGDYASYSVERKFQHYSAAVNDLGNEIATIVQQTHTPLYNNPENMVWVVDIEYLESKLQVDPSNPLNWYQLGRTYMTGHNFKPAFEAYRQAVCCDGRNPMIWTGVRTL
ncbi:hypothetical protein BDZ97DRAFT_1757133 [Flammula alnicola]|nr:hypothetical protein BDZ97DRAFT_1757133 [Flammula alnicola]